MASRLLPPMACSTNFSETTATWRPASLSSSSQRPARMGVSSSMAWSSAALAPDTVVRMVVSGSPYLAMVPSPTSWVSSMRVIWSGKAAVKSSSICWEIRSSAEGLESMNRRSVTPWAVPEVSSESFWVRLTVMLLTPMPDMESVTVPVMLLPTVTMAMTAAMPMMMPSMVSRLRILLLRTLVSAIEIFSKSCTFAGPPSFAHDPTVPQRQYPLAFLRPAGGCG